MPAKILHRESITTSREMEFFTEKELAMQIGTSRHGWPIALVKELIDNSLDACESAVPSIAPHICVTVSDDSVTVADNGPGLPLQTIKDSLNYLIRVSDKSYYVSPTRGQLGNALKCVWAAPFVANGAHGRVDVSTGGMTYQIDVSLDRIAQQPRLEMTTTDDDLVKTGTDVTIFWDGVACLLSTRRNEDFYHPPRRDLRALLTRYALCNPHASVSYLAPDLEDSFVAAAADPTWKKWLPTAPTAPHWYTYGTFQNLLLGYIRIDRARGRPRTVRDFIGEFHGLSGTTLRKEVMAMAGLGYGATLEDLLHADDVLRQGECINLLDAMQQRARVIQPVALGVIGADHIRAALSPELLGEELFHYRKRLGTANDIPYVLEVAFGVRRLSEDVMDDRDVAGLTTMYAINWTPALSNPFQCVDSSLSHAFVDHKDPVIVCIHLAYPSVAFTNRSKSTLVLPDEIDEALAKSIAAVTAQWKEMKRQADRERRLSQRAITAEQERHREKAMTTKEAVWQVMEQAYLKASDNGSLPANARQIMYAARPLVIALTGNPKPWKKTSQFTEGAVKPLALDTGI
jgi:DNA topoisomerase VI subunit B